MEPYVAATCKRTHIFAVMILLPKRYCDVTTDDDMEKINSKMSP